LKTTKSLKFEVQKVDQEARVVYGWAMISKTKDGKPVVDLQGDMVEPQELEKASWGFMSDSRQSGEMHEGYADNEVVASVVFTDELQKALSIPAGTVPVAWLIGVKLTPESAAKVKKGDLLMFSIEGDCERQEIAA
jgi:hypothetical protein